MVINLKSEPNTYRNKTVISKMVRSYVYRESHMGAHVELIKFIETGLRKNDYLQGRAERPIDFPQQS